MMGSCLENLFNLVFWYNGKTLHQYSFNKCMQYCYIDSLIKHLTLNLENFVQMQNLDCSFCSKQVRNMLNA